MYKKITLLLLVFSLFACNKRQIGGDVGKITFYGDFAIVNLARHVKHLTTMPPNNSVINYGTFIKTGRNQTPVKINVTLIGNFVIDGKVNADSYVGVTGVINTVNVAFNDEVVMALSANFNAEDFVKAMDDNDWRNAWGVILRTTKIISTTKNSKLNIKLTCDDENATAILDITNENIDVGKFIAECLRETQ